MKPSKKLKGIHSIDEWFTDFNKCPTNVPIFILKPDLAIEYGFIENGLIHSLIANQIYTFDECMAWSWYQSPY